MSKASGEASTAAPAAHRRRPTPTVAEPAGSNLKPILITMVLIVVAAATALLSGAANPLLLKYKAMLNPLVKAYGVDVGRPIRKVHWSSLTNSRNPPGLQVPPVRMLGYLPVPSQ